RKAIELERQALEVAGELGAHDVRELGAGDVLVVTALGLRRGGEDRIGQLLGLEGRPRQLLAGDGAERLVLGPGRARDVAARDALDVDPLAVLDEHRTADERLVLAECPREAPHVGADQVVGDDLLGLAEPEIRDLGQHATLVRYRRRKHDVERGEPVARHDHELVRAGLVYVPDLAATEERRALHARLEEHAHSGSTPLSRSRHEDATSLATWVARPRYSSGRSRMRRSSGLNFLRYSRRSLSRVATSRSVRPPRSASIVSRRTASCESGWPYFARST